MKPLKTIERKDKQNFFEQIYNNFKYEEIPDFGDVLTLEKFLDYVDSGLIIDYDGDGELIIDDKVVKHTFTWIAYKSFVINEEYIISFNILKDFFGDRMKVVWYNK
jgi:hypothetical protein